MTEHTLKILRYEHQILKVCLANFQHCPWNCYMLFFMLFAMLRRMTKNVNVQCWMYKKCYEGLNNDLIRGVLKSAFAKSVLFVTIFSLCRLVCVENGHNGPIKNWTSSELDFLPCSLKWLLKHHAKFSQNHWQAGVKIKGKLVEEDFNKFAGLHATSSQK